MTRTSSAYFARRRTEKAAGKPSLTSRALKFPSGGVLLLEVEANVLSMSRTTVPSSRASSSASTTTLR